MGQGWGGVGGDLAAPSYRGRPCPAALQLDLATGWLDKAGRGRMWSVAAKSGRGGLSMANTATWRLYFFLK